MDRVKELCLCEKQACVEQCQQLEILTTLNSELHFEAHSLALVKAIKTVYLGYV